MELIVGVLGVVVFLFLLSDLGGVWRRKEKEQGDQDKRDKGELPYGYFKKGRKK